MVDPEKYTGGKKKPLVAGKNQWWTTWKALVDPKKTTGELRKPLVAEKTTGEPLENHW